MLRSVCLFAATIAATVTLHAAPAIAETRPPAIAGVRLGADAGAALAVLRAHGITPSKDGMSWCVADYLANLRRPYTGHGHCRRMIAAPYDGGTLLLFAREDFPARPGTSIITSIALNDPTTTRTIETIARTIGPPTFTYAANARTSSVWCFGPPCRSESRLVSDPHAGPNLIAGANGTLTLSDPNVETLRFDAARRYLRAHGIARPEL
jgi:hypothetical protein